jgi:hypothetical protein
MIQILEAQTHPLTKVISRFIQLHIPLLPLKPMAQSRRGVVQILEAQTHPMAKAIPKFIQMYESLTTSILDFVWILFCGYID